MSVRCHKHHVLGGAKMAGELCDAPGKRARGKRQKRKRLLSPHNRHNTKPDVGVTKGRGVDAATSRTQECGIDEPRPAAQYPVLLFTATQPCAPIGRRTILGLVIPILTPLPNIAMHVSQAPGIRLLSSNSVSLTSGILGIPSHLT